MRIKDKILKGLATISVILTILCGCALDSKSDIPLIICGVCLLYLTLFILANTRD